MSFTTLDIGEESYELAAPTTMATGEEGDPPHTTMAVGEEERAINTTDALGEEDPSELSGGGVVDPFGAF